jgi:hypothetical protein
MVRASWSQFACSAHGRVGEQQPDVVAAARREAGEVGIQRGGAVVPRQDVQVAAEHRGGRIGELAELAADRRPHR